MDRRRFWLRGVSSAVCRIDFIRLACSTMLPGFEEDDAEDGEVDDGGDDDDGKASWL